MPPQPEVRGNCLSGLDAVSSVRDLEALKTAAVWARHLEAEGRNAESVLAIYAASERTGISFELLLLKAILESNLGEALVAERSSARGLFQFIEPTWLVLLKRYGADAGYPAYAKMIRIGGKTGIPHLKASDRKHLAAILELRNDPYVSAYIKARQIEEETAVIRALKNDKEVTTTDHYLVHMLGLKLAREFYDLMNTGSVITVARLGNPSMREAASLNKWFFYESGRPLVARDVYRRAEARVTREMRNIAFIREKAGESVCIRPSLLLLIAGR